MLEEEIIELDLTMEPRKAEEITGFLAANSTIEIKTLTTLLDLSNPARISSLLEALIEKDLIQGNFVNKNKILIDRVPEIPQNLEFTDIPTESLPLLGAMIGFEEFNISTYAELFRIRKKAVKQEICRLIAKGHISGVFTEKDIFYLEQIPNPSPIPIFEQNPLARMLLGASITHKEIELKNIMNFIGETDERAILIELLLLFAHQTLKGQIKIQRKNIKIFFEDIGYEKVPLPLSKLMGKYYTVVSALIAYQRISFKDLEKLIHLSVYELYQTIYTLAADGTIEPKIDKGEVWLTKIPPIPREMSLAQLSEQEIIVLGMGFGYKSFSLRSIARWLNVDTVTVREILLKLILNGLLAGNITPGSNEEYYQADVSSNLETAKLRGEDYIIIGSLLANEKANIRVMASQIGITTQEYERRLFILLAKRAFVGEIKGRYFLLNEVLADQPSTPISELGAESSVTTLGYLLARPEVNLRDMAKDLGWDREEATRNVYHLVGIGTIQGHLEGDQFKLQEAPQDSPTQTPAKLGVPYVKMVALLQAQSEEIFPIKQLAKSLRISQTQVREQLSRLIGENLIQGILETKQFTRMGDPTFLTPPGEKRACIKCGKTFIGSICPRCEVDTSHCAVCSKLFEQEDADLVNCPHCKAIAHTAHLKEWVKIRGTCPQCKNRLTMDQLEPFITDLDTQNDLVESSSM